MRFGRYVRYVYISFKEMFFGRATSAYAGGFKDALLGCDTANAISGGDRIRIDLTTGGFVEIEQHCNRNRHDNSEYIRIHLSTPKRVHYLDETYKYVYYGTHDDNFKLLKELRDAFTDLVDTQLGRHMY